MHFRVFSTTILKNRSNQYIHCLCVVFREYGSCEKSAETSKQRDGNGRGYIVIPTFYVFSLSASQEMKEQSGFIFYAYPPRPTGASSIPLPLGTCIE